MTVPPVSRSFWRTARSSCGLRCPGSTPDNDVEVTVSDGTLSIKAERREETKLDEKLGFRSEFRYGSYTRTIGLPIGATEEDVKATYRDGILGDPPAGRTPRIGGVHVQQEQACAGAAVEVPA
jgi:Hsp20/alpha crystallin family